MLNGGIHRSMLAPARVVPQLCGTLDVEEFKGGAIASTMQSMETEIENVVEMPNTFSHTELTAKV